MTPVRRRRGYTTFATGHAGGAAFLRIVSRGTARRWKNSARNDLALDPRVAFLCRQLAQDVMNRGTARESATRLHSAPAGKPAHRATDGLLDHFQPPVVIWIGFDDKSRPGITVAWWRTDGGLHDACTSLVAIPDVKDFAMRTASNPVSSIRIPCSLRTLNCPRHRGSLCCRVGPTVYCEVHGGHNLLSSAGSVLSVSLEENPRAEVDVNGQPVTSY